MNSSWMVAAVLAVAPPAQAAQVPAGLDLFLESPAELAVPVPTRQLAKLATVAHLERRLGVPSFVWGARPGPATAARLGSLESLSPEQAARRHLFELSELYRLSAADVAEARVRAVHDTGFGGLIVSFSQAAGGVEVFRGELSVLMTRQKDLVAMSGHLAPGAKAHKGYAGRFALTAQTAASVAFQDLAGEALDPGQLSFEEGAEGGYSRYRVSPSQSAALRTVPLIPLRTRPVLFELADGLEPGFYVEVKAGEPGRVDSKYFSYVVSAVDGRVLFRNNLTHEAAFGYRTFADSSGDFIPFDGPQGNDASPHPTGLPDGYQSPFVTAPLVTLDHAGLATNDPWLAAGATVTKGNNVDAYADVASPDGYAAGDVRPDVSSPGVFDYAFDVTLTPGANLTQRKAAVVNLFFVNNFLHDWYYDDGFNELSGNAQTSNLGRGGLQGDSLLAEGQDYSGKDNSNIQVPADGAHPQMQMYVFSGAGTRELAVTSPAAIAGNKYFGSADFGPTAFNIVADLWQAMDATAPVTDACSALVNGAELSGKVALVDRGNCTFAEKAAAAQAAGAVAVIIANNVSGGPMPLYGSGSSITIPAVSVSQSTGAAMATQLAAGTVVSVRLLSTAGVDRDGTLDNAIVAHEWGHYISNRLIGNANGLNNNQGGGLGEGWGDFHSLLMEVKESDALVASNLNWAGVYGLATYTSSGGGNNGYYYGIRRVPYSTDFSKNALTFKHIQDGVRLPTTAPVAFGSDGSSNAEVHASGEVWATMLWECYAALLRAPRLTFTQARDRMKAYLVASYKLTPGSPTFLEARDALLAAALASDTADFVAFGQAFARRGAGVGASGPDRASTNHLGVVESFVSGGDLSFVSAVLVDDVLSCDDDGVLDNTETGRLTVTLKNTGTADLAATTATVSSTQPALTFAGAGKLTFAASPPFGVVTATLEVSLSGMVGTARVPITVAFTDPGMATPRTVTVSYSPRLNYDELPNAATVDDVESANTRWTTAHDAQLDSSSPFRRVEDAGGTHWFAPDPASPESQWLVSPQLQVKATGSFVVSFRHRYSFEEDQGVYYDGAVIEARKIGAGWMDISSKASPASLVTINPGTTIRGTFYPSANPLRGRVGFGGNSPGYPAYVTSTIDLGATFAGSTVQVRFRTGGDEAAAAAGWDIDDIGFSGIDNKPFDKVVAGHLTCGNAGPVASAGEDQTVDEGERVTLAPVASDADGDPLTYAWTQTGGPSVPVDDAAAANLSFTAPMVTADTQLTFELLVSDPVLSAPASTVRVLVRNVNHAPVANAGVDQTVDERSEVMLGGQASADADADALAFHWVQVGGPEVELVGADTASPGFVAPEVSEDTGITFSLTVSDGAVTSEPAMVTVTVVDLSRVVGRGPAGLPKAGCGCAAGSESAAAVPFALAFGLLMVAWRAGRGRAGRA